MKYDGRVILLNDTKIFLLILKSGTNPTIVQ